METIDRKFRILAVNPVNGHTYTEKDAILLCAKDKAVIPALRAYHNACEDMGCNEEHTRSIRLLIARVERFQADTESRVPDTVGDEIARCIDGKGVE